MSSLRRTLERTMDSWVGRWLACSSSSKQREVPTRSSQRRTARFSKSVSMVLSLKLRKRTIATIVRTGLR